MDERVKIEEGGITVPAGAPAAAEAAPGGAVQSGGMPETGGAVPGGAAPDGAAPGGAVQSVSMPETGGAVPGGAAPSAAAPETETPKSRGVRGKVIGCLEEMAAIGLAVLGGCMFYNTRGTRLLHVDVAFGRICRFYWIALAGALVFFAVGLYTIKRSRKEVKKHGKLE